MKTTATILLLFLSNFCIGQTPWPETGTKWWYFGGDPLYGPRQIILEAVGEEEFKGQISQKIERTDVDFNGNALPNGAFFTFIRNDSVFFYSEIWEEYILIFDYTAEVGDSLIIKNASSRSGSDSIITFQIHQIDSIEKCDAGFKVKRWILDYNGWVRYTNYSELLMQDYFINPFDLYTVYGFDDADKFLRCFENNTHELDCRAYFNYEFELCYGKPSQVDEGEFITDISLFPNPVIDRLWVTLPQDFQVLKYLITDAAGREILRDYLDPRRKEIHVGQLPAGTYFLHFPGQKISIQKFIVVK